jgi:putative DNA primase/helicase
LPPVDGQMTGDGGERKAAPPKGVPAPKETRRHVSDDELRRAVEGRETEVLDALKIPWRSGRPHFRCHFPDHEDKNPSCRWDSEKRKLFCTCAPQGVDIAGVVMKMKGGLNYAQAKLWIVEILQGPRLQSPHRDDPIRTTSKRDPHWYLNPPSGQRDDNLPRIYLGFRLGLPATEVVMPTTPVAGWRELGYFDGDPKRPVGKFPAAVFALISPDGRSHAQRIYLASGGQGKAEIPPREDGTRRDPKKAVPLPKDERIDGQCVYWGDPATAPTAIVAEGIETAQAVAQAHVVQIALDRVAIVATVSASWMPQWKPWPANKIATIVADRDEDSERTGQSLKQGERAAHKLAEKLMAMGLRVALALPGAPGSNCDALDLWKSGGADAVRALIGAAQLWSPEQAKDPDPRADQIQKMKAERRVRPKMFTDDIDGPELDRHDGEHMDADGASEAAGETVDGLGEPEPSEAEVPKPEAAVEAPKADAKPVEPEPKKAKRGWKAKKASQYDGGGPLGPERPPAEPPTSPPDDALVLYPSSPLESAREYVRRKHIADGIPTLHCYVDEFYSYAGSHYACFGLSSVRKSLYEFLNLATYIDEKKKVRPFNPNRTKVGDVLDALRGVVLVPDSTRPPVWLTDESADFPASEIMAVRNGLLHLPTLRLLQPTPKFFNTNALSFAYDSNAPEPRNWLAFLKSIWKDDEASIECLQEIVDYLLTADTSQQKGFLLIGPKRCGKGTIARTVRKLIGPENCCGPTLSSFKDPFGLWTLLDKTLAIISDARLGSGLDHQAIVERLLSITGEDPLSVQRKFLPTVTTTLATRILILTNELPRFADASGALASRFILLVFTESFYGREDLGLQHRLEGELPGILNWAIKGWQRLRERGHFVPPQSSADMVEQFEHLSSPIKSFLKDYCEIGPGYVIAKPQLFKAWGNWCSKHGVDRPGTDATFSKNLFAAVPTIKTIQPRTEDKARTRYYSGIRLRK